MRPAMAAPPSPAAVPSLVEVVGVGADEGAAPVYTAAGVVAGMTVLVLAEGFVEFSWKIAPWIVAPAVVGLKDEVVVEDEFWV